MSFSDRLDAYSRRIHANLEACIERCGAPEALERAMHYAVFNGGKRIRPMLAYAAAEALGAKPETADAPATAVELVHCYSLVHDDLPAMDDDDLRRGQPTLHKAFDEATAILAGDALLTLAFEVLADSGAPPQLVGVLARAAGAGGMVGGQVLDIAFESTRPDRDALEQMFRRKTGALIRAAVEMPAAGQVAPATDPRRALVEYAESIGLAFQIVDDLLDIEGSTEQIGKPAGSDAAHAKATWPSLFGVDAARADAEALMARAARALERLPGDAGGLHWLGQRIVYRKT